MIFYSKYLLKLSKDGGSKVDGNNDARINNIKTLIVNFETDNAAKLKDTYRTKVLNFLQTVLKVWIQLQMRTYIYKSIKTIRALAGCGELPELPYP